MYLFKSTIIAVATSILYIAFGVQPAQAAALSFEPTNQEWSVGSTIVIHVHLDSAGEVINAIEGTITYSAERMQIVSVSHGGSSFTIWPEEPTVDSTRGLISFSAGIPNGSFIDTGEVLSIEVIPLDAGSASLTFAQNDTAVYLNDGFATKATLLLPTATYAFYDADPATLSITSPTHPDEQAWYQATTFIAHWRKQPGALYSVQVTANSAQALDDIPDDTKGTDIGEYVADNLADGVYYFMLKQKLSGETEWSQPIIHKLMIDATAPVAFAAVLQQTATEYDGQPFLVFNTSDATSGVDYYEVTEGDRVQQLTQGPYQLVYGGTVASQVKAVDRAGNSTSANAGPLEAAAITNRSSDWLMIAVVSSIGACLIGLMVILIVRRHQK